MCFLKGMSVCAQGALDTHWCELSIKGGVGRWVGRKVGGLSASIQHVTAWAAGRLSPLQLGAFVRWCVCVCMCAHVCVVCMSNHCNCKNLPLNSKVLIGHFITKIHWCGFLAVGIQQIDVNEQKSLYKLDWGGFYDLWVMEGGWLRGKNKPLLSSPLHFRNG